VSDDDSVERLTRENAELRQRVAALEKKVAQFDVLCSIMDNVVLVLDAEGIHVDATPTRLFPAEIAHGSIGASMREVFPKDVADAIIASIQRSLATGEPGTLDYPIHFLGRDLFHRGVYRPLSQGTVLWFATDVTVEHQLKTATRGLRTFEALVESAPDGVSMTSPDGAITYANHALRSMTNLGEALIGKRLFEIADAPREEVESALSDALSKGFWTGEMTLFRVGGKAVPCQVSILRLPGEAEPGRELAVVARDRTALIEAERQRHELQEKVIEAQRAALRELRTPLMPIAQGVIVMPLIGVIDAARAREVMERLLEGIVKQRAHTAILDVTGVAVVDMHVASALLQAARAARLLGSALILTGIGPEMARALVELQADMSGIVTLGDLESGVFHALRSAGAAGARQVRAL
jgi:PAS domain S-box-containing protein